MLKKDYLENIDGVAIEKLLLEYGSPLFVISEKRLRDNIRQLKQAFESRYQPVIHAWSYKTNYLNAVCATLHQEGSWAEIVSGFEYEKALALGVPATRILFNGPHKKRALLERCLNDGVRIHIDNLDELYLLDAIAKQQAKVVDVTLRLNLKTGYTEDWSRFGFNLESISICQFRICVFLGSIGGICRFFTHHHTSCVHSSHHSVPHCSLIPEICTRISYSKHIIWNFFYRYAFTIYWR